MQNDKSNLVMSNALLTADDIWAMMPCRWRFSEYVSILRMLASVMMALAGKEWYIQRVCWKSFMRRLFLEVWVKQPDWQRWEAVGL